jgi:hypothetical protein
LSSTPVYLMGDWFGRMLFSVTESTTSRRDDGRILQVVRIPEPYRPCAEFFWLCKGAMEAAPLLLSQSRAEVEADIGPRSAAFLIAPPAALSLPQRYRVWPSTRQSLSVVKKELQFQQERFEQERKDRLTLRRSLMDERSRRVRLESELVRLQRTSRR